MASETFTFSCPHCQTRLTVPVSLAGISGPCPSCRVVITAPKPDPDPEPRPEQVPAPESRHSPAPVETDIPDTPSRDGPAATGIASPDVEKIEALADNPGIPEEAEPTTGASGPRIRVEPRHLPGRTPAPPISTRRSTEDRRAKTREEAASEPGRRAFRLVHLLYPLVFLAAAVGVVGALFYFFGPTSPARKMEDASRPLVVQPSVKVEPPSTSPAPTGDQDLPTHEKTPPPPGGSEDATSPHKQGAKSPAVAAYELLESFLHATDSASRLAMVEPATTEAELDATLLKGPLPEFNQIFSELPQHRPDEQVTDFPYRVSFAVKGAPNVDYAILVRQRGDQPPRVFLPAFLDLVGGRLAAFTTKPNSSPPALFHVYLEPIDGCYEKEVPGADRKFTFKLLSSPFGKETARSYAANASRLRTLVENPDYPIRWGMRRRAMVTLQWNQKEDPAKPFLELVDLNSPDWNP